MKSLACKLRSKLRDCACIGLTECPTVIYFENVLYFIVYLGTGRYVCRKCQ